MKIEEIFRHDLAREIKEVIKVDDADRGDVENEIREYVVTEHIHDAFVELLDQYQESIQNPTEVVNSWVSGFFGSGKSSFAKIFGYVLSNPNLGGSNAADLFTSKLATQQIRALLNTIHAQAPTLAVFVDLSSSRNVMREGESVVLPLYRQLLTELDYARDVVLANLEITLEESGDLPQFVAAFREATGFEWKKRRDKALALNEASKALCLLKPDIFPAPDSYARTRPEVVLDANGFAKRALDLLARRRPELRRITFIVDEVGQYVSRSVHRMLDLQGLAHACQKEDGRLWLVATGQETLEDVVGALGDKRVELARVRDRFPLTVDLVPGDIEEVVTKRVLDKNDAGAGLVRRSFEAHKNQLRANVSLESPARTSDVTADEFVRIYPLLPYQIQLFIDAVSALRAHGGAGPMVGGANRTLIRLAHQLVRTAMAARPVGDLATVPMAYDLMDDMIPGPWRGEIDQVAKRHGGEGIETLVAKTVALVSGVRALRLNNHNLAVLLHPAVDAESRLGEVARALETLVHEEALREGEEGYRLQSPQEKDWEKGRCARELKTGDFNRLLRDRHLPAILRGLTASAGREFTVEILFDDDKLLDGDLVLRIYEGGSDQLERAVRRSRETAHENDVFLVFERSDSAWRHSEEVFRSQEIIKDAEARSLPTETDLLHEERKRYDRAVRQFERALVVNMLAGTIAFRGNEASLEGRDLRSALSNALGGCVNAVYARIDEFVAPVRRTDAVALLKADDLAGLPDYLGPARLRVITADAEGFKIDENGPVSEFVKAVKDRVERMGSEPTGKWLESHFHNPPFGAETDIVMILGAAAVRAGLVRVAHGGVWLSNRADVRLERVFGGVREFRAAAFRAREELDVNVRSRVARLLHHDIVGERPGIGTEELASFARKHLDGDREAIESLSATLTGLGLTVPESIARASQMLRRMRSEDDEDLIQSLDAGRSELKDGILTGRNLGEFVIDDRLDVLRQAKQVLDADDNGLSVQGRQALADGHGILRAAAYVERFAELRGALETVKAERRAAWEVAQQELQRVVDEIREQAAPLLSQVGDAAREEFHSRLAVTAVAEDLALDARPSRDMLVARAAQLPGVLDDLRAEVGRRHGKEVRRVAIHKLVPEPVRNEDQLEALLVRIRAAGEEALKDDEFFLLI